MTLITESSSSGVTRRCDERCYNAKQPHCDCICGGLNHGAGRAQAASNTHDLAAVILGKYAAARKPEGAYLHFNWVEIRPLLTADLPLEEQG